MKKNTVPTAAELVSDRYAYSNIVRLGDGDVCHIIGAKATPVSGGNSFEAIIKVARAESVNDLVNNEAVMLDSVRRHVRDIAEHADGFFPRLLDTFLYDGNRAVNVIERLDGYYTLEEIRDAYPEGLPPQAAAWMGNRLFEFLSLLSLSGVVHGGILPPHVLFHFGDSEDPIRHTMKVIDWTLAMGQDKSTNLWPKRQGRITRYDDFYPPEKADQVTPATDLAMAAACLQYVMGADVKSGKLPSNGAPRGMEFLLKSCRYPQPDGRPKVIFFRQQFREMLNRHYGEGRFHYTPMPRV